MLLLSVNLFVKKHFDLSAIFGNCEMKHDGPHLSIDNMNQRLPHPFKLGRRDFVIVREPLGNLRNWRNIYSKIFLMICEMEYYFNLKQVCGLNIFTSLVKHLLKIILFKSLYIITYILLVMMCFCQSK